MVIRKKISLFLLLFFISIVAIGCSGIDLKINGIDDLEVGESFQLTILDPEEEINDISWSSSDIKIATVDDSGIVMGIGEGTATITATAKNALGSVTVTVIPQRTLKIIAPDNLQIGSSTNISAQINPLEEEVNVTWSSENPFVVHIDENGKISALNEGTAIITATYDYQGKRVITDAVSITIYGENQTLEKIDIVGRNVVMIGKTIDLVCTTYPINSNDEIIWTSDDENIATVNGDGKVLGKTTGDVLITATVKNDPLIKFTKAITVIGNSETTTYLEATYIIDEVTAYNELPYGVIHTTNKAFTSTPLSGVDADGLNGVTEEIVPNKLYPQQVNVLEVPSSTDIRITTWANLDNNKWALTTVRGLISKYEAANPGWKVIAAINGDFFDIGANGNLPYQTSGAMVSNGEFYRTTTGSTIGFTNDGSTNTLIGNENIKRTDKMILAIYDENDNIIQEFDIDKLNQTPDNGETSIYFAIYNSDKEIVPFELNLEGKNGYVVEEAIKALPNNANDFYGIGVISSTSSTTITQGNFAIVTENDAINQALSIGKKIRCQYEYIGEYKDATDLTGCGGTLIPATSSSIPNRAPRTVIGQKADGTIVMMVIDGRQGNKDMYGADALELGAIMSAYGCVEAYNLDGGGSSTLVIRSGDKFITTNSPSDGKERSDANCILIVVKDPVIEYEITDITQNEAKLNIEVTDEMDKDIDKVFIKIDGNTYEVSNNQVSLNNLIHNTEYSFDIYYQTNDGKIYKSMTSGTFKTQKNMPTYYNFVVEETDEAYEFYIYYKDDDSASTLPTATLKCNGFTLFMKDGRYTFKKSYIKDGSPLSDISLSYSYALGTEKRTSITIDKVEYLYINNLSK